MTTEQLEALLEHAGEHAEHVLVKMHANLPPTWVIVTEGGNAVLTTPWQDEFERGLARMFIRNQLRTLRARGFSMVVECWIAKSSKEELERGDYVMPSRRPDRREVVMGLASDGQTHLWRSWAIIRDYLDQVRALGPAESFEDAQMESWFSELM